MKSEIDSRLNRIVGQIKAIQGMIEKWEDCEKISIQFKAVKSWIEKVFRMFLNKNLETCVSTKNNEKLQKIIKWMVNS